MIKVIKKFFIALLLSLTFLSSSLSLVKAQSIEKVTETIVDKEVSEFAKIEKDKIKNKNDNLNTLRILSQDTNRNKLLGFKYEVINNDTKEKVEVDLTKVSEASLKLENGTYTIKQTKVSDPSKYKIEDAIEVKLPYKFEDNTSSKEVAIYLKHKEIKKIPDTPFIRTGQSTNYAPLIISVIAAAGVVITLYTKPKTSV